MKFGVITDCQYADVGPVDYAPERKYRKSPKKLKESIEFFNNEPLEFVIHLGDLIDQQMVSFDVPLEIIKHSKHKFYHVLGNHDFDSGDRETFVRIPKNDVLNKLKMSNNYYSFTVGLWKFIVLDTNELGVIEGPNDSAVFKEGNELLETLKKQGKINAQPWNGTISEEQEKWFENELVHAQTKDLHVVVCAHHQVFPENREQVLDPERITAYFEKYDCIKAYISGHNHAGDFGVLHGVPCITFKGMLDTDENSYSIVELTDNGLVIYGYGREKSRIIKTRV